MHSNTNFLVETRKVNKKYIYKYVILAKAPCKEQFPVNLTQRRPEESVKPSESQSSDRDSIKHTFC